MEGTSRSAIFAHLLGYPSLILPPVSGEVWCAYAGFPILHHWFVRAHSETVLNREGGILPMASTDDSAVWVQKGATLSDKTAQKAFGLREEDIIQAIKAGKLQYRHNTLYGNPCLKLLREAVECLVNEKYGREYLQERNAKTELGKVTTEIRSLQRKLAQLEKRKAELSAVLDA